QATDVRRTAQEAGGRAGADDGVQFAGFEHARQGLVVRDLLEVDRGIKVDRGTLVTAGFFNAAAAPVDLGRLDAVLILQNAADPDVGGDLVFRHADGLAAQVFRAVDAPVGTDVDAGLAEYP